MKQIPELIWSISTKAIQGMDAEVDWKSKRQVREEQSPANPSEVNGNPSRILFSVQVSSTAGEWLGIVVCYLYLRL